MLNKFLQRWRQRGNVNTNLVIVVAAVLLFAGLFVFLKFNKSDNPISQKTGSAVLSGRIDFTALKPEPGDKGEVQLLYREMGSTAAFTDSGLSIALKDDQPWEWNKAVSGKNYELQAVLVIDGDKVKTSDIQTITAPASNVALGIGVHWRDLPKSVVAKSSIPIGGTVKINGYIPPKSTLVVLAVAGESKLGTEVNEKNAETVATIKNPTNSNAWTWDKAVPTSMYLIEAVLKGPDGKVISKADSTIQAEAADDSVALLVNSAAQPPAPTAAPTATPKPNQPTPVPTVAPASKSNLSGTVYVNGPEQNNSSILVLWRKPGQGDYQVVNRYQDPSHGGTNWSWDGAKAGEQYEITVALQVNEKNTATAANSVIVRAPATGVNFTLNTNYSLGAPGQPRLESCNNKSNNQWDATIIYPRVENAGNYWLQLGNNPGYSDIRNMKLRADSANNDQRVTVRVNDHQQLYARYAYSNCANCSNDQDFSQFSGSVNFMCTDLPM